jgi:hypothetical protein
MSDAAILSSVGIVTIILVMIGLLLLFLPTYVAFRRKHRNRVAILILNILLGWWGIPWIIFLVWAFSGNTEDDVYYVEVPPSQYPPLTGQPYGQPGQGYLQPGQPYGQPGQGYQQPGLPYGAPGQGYQQPGQPYGPPGQGYQQPVQPPGQPGQGYRHPGQPPGHPGPNLQKAPQPGRAQPGRPAPPLRPGEPRRF